MDWHEGTALDPKTLERPKQPSNIHFAYAHGMKHKPTLNDHQTPNEHHADSQQLLGQLGAIHRGIQQKDPRSIVEPVEIPLKILQVSPEDSPTFRSNLSHR